MPVPQTQLDNYKIILNIQEINLRTDRTNCTTRRRTEATSRKVEMQRYGLGRNRSWLLWRGMNSDVRERQKEREKDRETEREECIGICTRITLPQSHCLGKIREADFHEFL